MKDNGMNIRKHRTWKHVLLVIALSVSACMFLLSCRHIPLYDPDAGLYLDFNITEGPSSVLTQDIMDGIPTVENRRIMGEMPQLIIVDVYDAATHELVLEEYLPPRGGFVNIEQGTYSIIAYGCNSEVNRFDGTSSLGSARALTSEIGSVLKFTKTDGEGEKTHIQYPIIYEPDHIFVATAEDVVILPKADRKGTVRLEMKANTLLESYTFEAVNVKGVEHISRLTCYVTGQVPSRYMWDRHWPSDICAIPVEAAVDQETGHIIAAFNTFGKHPQAFANVFLNVMVENYSGGMYQWIYDVTGQFDDPDNVDHNLVITDEIFVPDSDAGGFTPDVNDWSGEIIHVPL